MVYPLRSVSPSLKVLWSHLWHIVLPFTESTSPELGLSYTQAYSEDLCWSLGPLLNQTTMFTIIRYQGSLRRSDAIYEDGWNDSIEIIDKHFLCPKRNKIWHQLNCLFLFEMYRFFNKPQQDHADGIHSSSAAATEMPQKPTGRAVAAKNDRQPTDRRSVVAAAVAMEIPASAAVAVADDPRWNDVHTQVDAALSSVAVPVTQCWPPPASVNEAR